MGFKDHDNRRVHMRTHYTRKPYKCDLCWKGLESNHDLRVHIQTHNVVTPHTYDTMGRYSDILKTFSFICALTIMTYLTCVIYVVHCLHRVTISKCTCIVTLCVIPANVSYVGESLLTVMSCTAYADTQCKKHSRVTSVVHNIHRVGLLW